MKPPSGALTPPSRLRLKHDSVSAEKIELVIAAGDELEVSEDLAAQLVAAGNFRDPADVPEPGPQVVLDQNGEVDFEASPREALDILGLTPPPAEESAPVKPAPKKRTRKPKASPA